MDDQNSDKQKLIDYIQEIVYTVLKNENLLQAEWHLGRVESVLSPTMLSVFVDGSTISQKIPCSKRDTYAPNDEIWVQFVNRDSKNKFAKGLRGI
ncbi:hypothetical protein [Brevibacillus sp. NRS-1366]|uniref:hypothetical protein n=1 Tax=Brevibacillus sp. NRS-1366 TaxID=3233899 RepID=UPI003D242E66